MSATPPRFPQLPTDVDLPAAEQETLERWRSTKVFQRSLEETATGPRWIFYEGPPTANGKPGVHHVEARVFKDLFPRFKTMKGYHVPRRAGWDCHGLPVELLVEKELGFTKKQDVEAYGIAEFNALCRESALRHVGEFATMTERMGYWVDLDNAYYTMDTSYIESVWWSLQKIFNDGRLVEDYRVAPYCPRDETPLSDHEVSLGYTELVDPSVYVRFPLVSGLWADRGAALLVWTTTPWTLVSNTAVAAHPEVEYVLARTGDELLVVAAELVGKTLGEDAEVLERRPGSALAGSRYTRPLDLLPIEDFAGGDQRNDFAGGDQRVLGGDSPHVVVTAEYVSTTSGTGLVHLAPAFGAEDLVAARQHGLPLVNPIEPDSRFRADVPLVGGQFFKDADSTLVEALRESGVLYKFEPYKHTYPLCWRCDTKLIYYALPSWYIRTTAVRDRLVAENERTNWHPPHIRDGRYGEWLKNNVDWALSRNRFWGTPLPIWRCTTDRSHLVCVGSLAELSDLAGQDLSTLDPHRPYVDDVVLPCPTCGDDAKRVPEVIDVWYDSGAMPFAQWGAPHRNQQAFEDSYPANYICEAIDQTRGWFYSLMAEGTLLFDRSSYETVLCLGLILDAEGRKMSKHVGNVIDPFTLFDKYGADAVRWLMLAGGSPWGDRRLGPDALDEVVRKVLLTLWNTASFLTLYARAADWTPATGEVPAVADRPLLDRWLMADLHGTVRDVDAALENFDSSVAGRRINAFIDSLSNWYVRRSRRRFWRGDPAALATLHDCLDVLTRLMAPFVPFVTDYLWQQVVVSVNPDAADSVHLASWPQADPALIDDTLLAQMAMVQRIVELGRATRSAGKVRTRQPLSRAMVVAPGFADLPEELRQQIADELNVNAVEPLTGVLVEVMVKPNFRALGARFGSRTQQVAKAISAAGVPTDGQLVVTVDGEEVTLTEDELIISESAQPGWSVTSDGGVSVALDLELTDELRQAGLVRDALRRIQESRKALGLEVTDRIVLNWASERDDVAEALRAHGSLVADEVLATSMVEGPAKNSLPPQDAPELGLTVWISKASSVTTATDAITSADRLDARYPTVTQAADSGRIITNRCPPDPRNFDKSPYRRRRPTS